MSLSKQEASLENDQNLETKDLKVEILENDSDKEEVGALNREGYVEFSLPLVDGGGPKNEAKFLSIVAGDHAENHDNLKAGSKVRAFRKLKEEGLVYETDEGVEISQEVPKKMIEYAQVASISETIEEIEINDKIDGIKSFGNESESIGDYKDLERFIQAIDTERKRYWRSKTIAERSDVMKSAKQVGQNFKNMNRDYGVDDEVYNQEWKAGRGKATTWDLEVIQEYIQD